MTLRPNDQIKPTTTVEETRTDRDLKASGKQTEDEMERRAQELKAEAKAWEAEVRRDLSARQQPKVPRSNKEIGDPQNRNAATKKTAKRPPPLAPAAPEPEKEEEEEEIQVLSPRPEPSGPDSAKYPPDNNKNAAIAPRVTHDKWRLYAFLLSTTIYLVVTIWFNLKALSKDKHLKTGGEDAPIDVDTLYKVAMALAVGTGSAFVTFWIAVFWTTWYYWFFVVAILFGSAVPLGVTIWKCKSTGNEMYYTGMVALGAIFLCGTWAGVVRPKRTRATLVMFKSFRSLLRRQSRAYMLIVAWTLFQTMFKLWYTLSLAAVVVRFQPESQACKDSTCGWGIVGAIGLGYLIAHSWLSNTLSEVLNATLTGGVFVVALKGRDGDPRLGHSLQRAGYRSLGSLARNAIFADNVEMLCFPFKSILDKVPWVNDQVASWLGWFLDWLGNMLGRYNKFIGIAIAIRGFNHDHRGSRASVERLVKSGNINEDRKYVDADDIGRPMGPVTQRLRGYTAAVEDQAYWQTGLGAFMSSQITKHLLVGGALACGLLSAATVYSSLILALPGPKIWLDRWDWTIIGWSLILGYSIAYHLLMTIEACICSIYYMILKTSAEDVGSMIFPVRDLVNETAGNEDPPKIKWLHLWAKSSELEE